MHYVQWLFTMPPWVTPPGIGIVDVARRQLIMGVKLGEQGRQICTASSARQCSAMCSVNGLETLVRHRRDIMHAL
jgi:hypothetical protein